MACRPTWMPQSYEEAVKMLRGRKSKIIGNNTDLHLYPNGQCVVRHFFTDIVLFNPDGDVVFNTSYRTLTTRSRMNCAHPMVQFFQKKHQLVINYKGMNIHPDQYFCTSEASDDLEPVE